ncbi:MAG: DUF3014 domain-containing protein [Nitrospirota bacterium]|jgi:hypothetical protein
MKSRFLVLGSLVVVLAVAGLIWWQGREAAPPPGPPAPPPSPEEPAVPVQPAPAPALAPQRAAEPEPPAASAEPTKEPVVLPPLAESDPYVREEVLASSPKLADWLDRDQLVRRIAVVIDNAAVGDVPRRQLAFLAPAGRFRVIKISDDRFVMDPKGYPRYDGFVDLFTSVPPENAAALLTTLAPLLSQALSEIGQPAEEPLATLRDAIGIVLATPELDTAVELVQPKVMYKFADPTLEALPPLQKQLIRMGPDHVRRIKAYLREVEAAL